jgi:hypothetical protein
MKSTRIKTAAVALLLCLFAIAMPNTAKAQANCPYTITNNLACPIDIQYTIFAANCGSYSNIVSIPPYGTYTINCSEFPNGCETADIELNLLKVNNQGFICKPPYSNGVASNTTFADASGMFPNSAPCTSIFMTWTPFGCTINP